MSAKRMLVWLLFMAGTGMLCALVFVFCPFEWMAAIHRRIGLGELAYTPVLSYLIRTLSALYATMGGILLFVCFDLDRYLPLVRFLGIVAILSGVGVTILDAVLHLPTFWTVAEGPLTVALGVAMLILAHTSVRTE